MNLFSFFLCGNVGIIVCELWECLMQWCEWSNAYWEAEGVRHGHWRWRMLLYEIHRNINWGWSSVATCLRFANNDQGAGHGIWVGIDETGWFDWRPDFQQCTAWGILTSCSCWVFLVSICSAKCPSSSVCHLRHHVLNPNITSWSVAQKTCCFYFHEMLHYILYTTKRKKKVCLTCAAIRF